MARKKEHIHSGQQKVVIGMPKDIKNARGALGPICSACAGFGFTLGFPDGKSLTCKLCGGTGVPEVDLVDLQKQVIDLTRLVKALYGEMKKQGLTVIQ